MIVPNVHAPAFHVDQVWGVWSGQLGVEARVDRLEHQVDIEIPLTEAELLLASGEYDLDTGLRSGRHYRKTRGQGCYHLRIHGTKALLHWDQWDPRRFALQHFFETPELWGTGLVVGVGAAILIGLTAK